MIIARNLTNTNRIVLAAIANCRWRTSQHSHCHWHCYIRCKWRTLSLTTLQQSNLLTALSVCCDDSAKNQQSAKFFINFQKGSTRIFPRRWIHLQHSVWFAECSLCAKSQLNLLSCFDRTLSCECDRHKATAVSRSAYCELCYNNVSVVWATICPAVAVWLGFIYMCVEFAGELLLLCNVTVAMNKADGLPALFQPLGNCIIDKTIGSFTWMWH